MPDKSLQPFASVKLVKDKLIIMLTIVLMFLMCHSKPGSEKKAN